MDSLQQMDTPTKNRQRRVWTKTVRHHSLKSSYFSHGSTRLLSSALYNWTVVTQDQKNKILLMCGCFWSEIFYQRLFRSSSRFPKKHYAISTDWEGRNYLLLKIDWNYSKKYVDISMTEYLKKALDILQHPKPKIPQYAPHRWTVPTYGKRLQIASDPYNSDLLDKKSTKVIQSIVVTMLYYSQLVDPMIPQAINEIS